MSDHLDQFLGEFPLAMAGDPDALIMELMATRAQLRATRAERDELADAIREYIKTEDEPGWRSPECTDANLCDCCPNCNAYIYLRTVVESLS